MLLIKLRKEFSERFFNVPINCSINWFICCGSSSSFGLHDLVSNRCLCFACVPVCDPKSLLFLFGMQLDYSDALIGGGFAFSNPNATSTCGCGKSFAA